VFDLRFSITFLVVHIYQTLSSHSWNTASSPQSNRSSSLTSSFAGAGTGKTTTITAKIAHMVEMEGIDSLPGYSRSPSPKKLQGTCAKKSKNFFRDRK